MSMPNFLNVNSIHLHFLAPLSKWRILDLKSLREEADYPLHPDGFAKNIRKLEKAQILKSFKDPWSRRKYIYLTPTGEKLVNDSGRPSSLSEETIVHDAKVSQIVRLLLERSTFQKVELEHEIKSGDIAKLPDSILYGKKGGVDFTMAFELEFTRKSKERIKDKIGKYLGSGYYDYVLYMFCSENVFKSYKNTIGENFGEQAFKKVMLFWNPTLMSKRIDLHSGGGYFKNKEVSFVELF